MFTGLIEEVGKVKGIQRGGQSIKLAISAKKVLNGLKLGDSIATNGICLTVVSFDDKSFIADVMPETMSVSNLNMLSFGDEVNLERALCLGDRLGGHMVSGHIDSTGVIEKFQKDDNATWVTIRPPKEFMRYVLHKGSIAIDGVSLTIASVDEGTFKVSIIPMTKDETSLLKKKVGGIVNLEGDMIGKYVEQMLFFGNKSNDDESSHKQSVTLEKDAKASYDKSMNFLRENGFA